MNLSLGPVVVCLDQLRLHVSPPPLLLVVHMCDFLAKHLEKLCIHECEISLERESRMLNIQEFCRFQTRMV